MIAGGSDRRRQYGVVAYSFRKDGKPLHSHKVKLKMDAYMSNTFKVCVLFGTTFIITFIFEKLRLKFVYEKVQENLEELLSRSLEDM